MSRAGQVLFLFFLFCLRGDTASITREASKCESLNGIENEQKAFTVTTTQCFLFITNPDTSQELLQFRLWVDTSDSVEVTVNRKGAVPSAATRDNTVQCTSSPSGPRNHLTKSRRCSHILSVPSDQFGGLPNRYVKQGEAWVVQIKNYNYYFGAKVTVKTVIERRPLPEEDLDQMVDELREEGSSWSRTFIELFLFIIVATSGYLLHTNNAHKYKKMMETLKLREKQIEDKETELDEQQKHLEKARVEADEKNVKRMRGATTDTPELSAPILQKQLKQKTIQASKLEFQVNSLQKQCKQLKEMNQSILVQNAPTVGNLFKTVFTTKQRSLTMEPGVKKILVDVANVIVADKLVEGVGGSFAGIYNCYVDGWSCCMKELVITEGMLYHLPNIKEKFLTEIKLLENLPYHPNITRYLFHREMDDKIQLFTTKYSGSLLDMIELRRGNLKRLKEETKLSPNSQRRSAKRTKTYFSAREICDIAMQIMDGLEFLHNHDVIHRDLKSDNILVTLNNNSEISTIYIADFDTAKKLTEDAQIAKTAIGTPGFIAPEVWNAEEYTYKCDVFSFGMVLYELLSLMRPFENAKGNPQFHINDRKVPPLQLDDIIENIQEARRLGDINLAADEDEKGTNFSFAALVTLYHK
ncbi:hypothetical protein PROFUN_02644 [Planoprotostelium fungivorum]|uniref:non-specific serine/threonine protein kinase n=1 Tax=Planoprotostelium fungivorum TaxID=1890364 RepID=A0A2P6NVA3_9EUKA|nr:hypothetical protein PROFUN_02644 [Planoprotostelium fungivorum]